MTEVTRTLIYHGDAARASALVQMLQEAGVRVDWEPPDERRDLTAMAEEVVVNVVSTGTVVAIGWAVRRFRARFPRHKVDASPDVEAAAASDEQPDNAGGS